VHSPNGTVLFSPVSTVTELAQALATFRRKIDVSGSTVNGFGRAKTAGLPAVFFEGLW
jgi:hypothetical protein